jgi:hypothetical protein
MTAYPTVANPANTSPKTNNANHFRSFEMANSISRYESALLGCLHLNPTKDLSQACAPARRTVNSFRTVFTKSLVPVEMLMALVALVLVNRHCKTSMRSIQREPTTNPPLWMDPDQCRAE